ncbi:AEC family transporter [Algoriphagus sp. NBT04N3]|jgi:predicted permease|uniref:AEC family transporter n=1 Tax=Algoriphagus sp. NBT04N3 TaxID=2705473 RepID=UPI001C632307|nr:AEC family transporter [Algoriphagus sp. NBT04N3]QYH40367.1 AEC family transporter [Algoriphagus sp. NBT04N3]
MIGAVISFLFLIAGLVFQRKAGFPTEKAISFVNSYLFILVLPALALLYIPQIKPGWDLLIPISAAWLTFLLSWLLFGTLGKIFHWSKQVTGCLAIVAGLANTSFLGFPVVEALYGKSGLPIALLIDQGGSFLLVSSLAIVIGSIYSHQSGRLREIPLKIIKFPPFGFLVGTLIMSLLGWKTPEFLMPFLTLVGKTMAPMALLAIGLRFRIEKADLTSQYFWYGLAYRLVFAPLLVYLIYSNFMDTEGLTFKVTVLESGMAPMITGSIVAINYNLAPRLAALLSGLGMIISLFSLTIWYFFLG